VFINDTLLYYCERRQIEFTRSRAYRKNDQAWIEQKNGAVIRRFVGHERFAGVVVGQTLARLYQALRLYVNHFQPSFKLREKRRYGSKLKKSLFGRLHQEYPGRFHDGQLRTLQRRIREWRQVMARKLVFSCYEGREPVPEPSTIGAEAGPPELSGGELPSAH